VTEFFNENPDALLCGFNNKHYDQFILKGVLAGFTPQERAAMTKLLDSGFVDTFRHLHPDVTGAYSWWSYMFSARAKNAGWRIDYFLVSERIADKITAAEIHSDVMGSDHCPVVLEIDL